MLWKLTADVSNNRQTLYKILVHNGLNRPTVNLEILQGKKPPFRMTIPWAYLGRGVLAASVIGLIEGSDEITAARMRCYITIIFLSGKR